MIGIKYCSQKGLCDTNQDFILCKQLQDGSCIAILADGMGGLQYGEIAAATVAQSIYKILAEHNSVDIRELLAKDILDEEEVRLFKKHFVLESSIRVIGTGTLIHSLIHQ